MEDNNKDYLNPWVTMWVKPRATIQQIVDDNPKHYVLLLAAVSGIPTILSEASVESRGDRMGMDGILPLAAIVGSALGIILLYVVGWVLRWTGRWIGGKATSQHIRAALAWSNVPTVLALLLWVPLLIIIGQELFTSETPRIGANLSLALILGGFHVIQIVATIWTMVLLVKSLGQVQGFSSWKAIFNLILSIIVFFGCTTLIVLTISLLTIII